jgi:glyoxylase-like metal-dependent hydrolase (beta-lactamase superfamily II)
VPQTKLKQILRSIVFPITIATPFAVGDVHCYLIRDEKNVLVDCGHKSKDSYKQLKSALLEQGLKIKDIDEIWLTHGHPDHFGQAAILAEEAGAVTKGHRKERSNFAADDNGKLFRDYFAHYGIPEKQIAMMVNQLDWLLQYQEAIEPDWIGEESKLSSGKLTFSVKHAPGHAPGHVVFYEQGGSGLIFGGDVLLEHISTNALINFDPDTGERNKSLMQYRKSLQWMKKKQGLVLPGHGKQIENIQEVAGHHLDEQNNRFLHIMQLLAEAPKSLLQLSHQLFPDQLKQGAHFLVFSEIAGYLDWGKEKGTIAEEDAKFFLAK